MRGVIAPARLFHVVDKGSADMGGARHLNRIWRKRVPLDLLWDSGETLRVQHIHTKASLPKASLPKLHSYDGYNV